MLILCACDHLEVACYGLLVFLCEFVAAISSLLNQGFELLILWKSKQLLVELIEDLFIDSISWVFLSSLDHLDRTVDHFHDEFSIIFIFSQIDLLFFITIITIDFLNY